MTTRLLALLVLLHIACVRLASSPITITRSTTYQTLEGFGALGAMKAWSDPAPYFDTNSWHASAGLHRA